MQSNEVLLTRTILLEFQIEFGSRVLILENVSRKREFLRRVVKGWKWVEMGVRVT